MKIFNQISKIICLLLLSLISLEIWLGYFYFQRSFEKGSSFVWFWQGLQRKFFDNSLPKAPIPSKAQYAQVLENLLDLVKIQKIEVSVLYLPQLDASEVKRDFFKQQALKHQVTFIDLTEHLSEHSKNWVYNLPYDGHLSRFGHALVSQALEKKIKWNYLSYEKPIARQLLGPHPKKVDTVNRYNEIAYRVQTNSQGFRMVKDIDKSKSAIIFLGDSFTYGTGVNTFEAYPELLNQKFANTNVINAGIAATSLIEQVDYFSKIAKDSKITQLIIQVLDNDVLAQ